VDDLISRAGETPASGYPEGLSQREADVLCLISKGKTDWEIAEELIIAIRTVNTHVGHILNKTGATNRSEAAV
jgi:NarL family two-component system response regulator LiaR